MNTLVVSLDAVRSDHVGQYGYTRDTLPAADQLTGGGSVRYEQAIVNGTYTGISLPSMLTSRYRGDEAVRSGPTLFSALPDDVKTCAIHSNTFFASKFDDIYGADIYEDFFGRAEHDDDIPLSNRAARRVFDAVRPRLKRLGAFEAARRLQERLLPPSLIHEVAVFESAQTTTDRALQFVTSADGEFAAWVHYMDPHRPYAINADDPAFAPALDRGEIIGLMAKAGVDPESVTEDERRRLIDLYDSAIRYTSEHISRLFDGLREAGVWDDTAVVLTADHGEEFSEHGRYFHRNRPYDELIRVPLFLRVPGETDRQESVDAPRELLDVAPTLCRIHGVDPPSSFLGTDLRESGSRHPMTTGSFRDDGPVVAARWGGWKYISTDDGPELYDLGTDPGERHNVAADYPDRCDDYRQAVPQHLLAEDDAGVPDADEVSEDTQRRLKDLGYLE